MTKTKEELNTLKHEYETLVAKLKELSDEELKTVIGGTTESNDVTTRMECEICDYYSIWAGDYLGQKFECPRCHAMSLVGVSKKGLRFIYFYEHLLMIKGVKPFLLRCANLEKII